jgi:hypothetical protein
MQQHQQQHGGKINSSVGGVGGGGGGGGGGGFNGFNTHKLYIGNLPFEMWRESANAPPGDAASQQLISNAHNAVVQQLYAAFSAFGPLKGRGVFLKRDVTFGFVVFLRIEHGKWCVCSVCVCV